MIIYTIKEIHYTIQGEGARAGTPAIFIRFSGCNLWSGREEDRVNAICNFCDTEFRGTDGHLGGKYNAVELARLIDSLWPTGHPKNKFVVCTGGEPLLQLDSSLVDTFHEFGFEVACETNGTIAPPGGLDWICMSPKANTDIQMKKGNELKIVFPQNGIDPSDFAHFDFDHFFLQPMYNDQLNENMLQTVAYCKKHPQWKLSLQIHKILQIP